MASITICSDFGVPQNKVCQCFYCFPTICHEVMGPDAMIFVFWIWALSQLFHSPLSLSSRGSLVFLHFLPKGLCHLHIWGYSYFSWQSWFYPAQSCVSSSPAFLMMYSAYKLNKRHDTIQPWCTPFLIQNQSVVPCPVLTVASSLAYRFLRKQVWWSGIPISWRIFQFVVIHTVKGFGIVNQAEEDVFSGTLLLFLWPSGSWQFDLWFPCLF